jgi:polyhydroxybutyrate depolymerase
VVVTVAALGALLGALTVACSSSSPARQGAATTHAGPPSSTSSPTTTVPADCSPARPAPVAGAHAFAYGGQARSYLLAVPATYDGRHAVPLVLSLHGFNGRKEAQEVFTRMGKKGAARGFLVVTPDSLENPPQWNAFGAPNQPDDFGFVHALVSSLEHRFCIDASRVFAAGHSNGAAFAAFLACTKPYDFAAVATVSATTPAGCPKGVTPSVLAIAGTADESVPYAGGTVDGTTIQIPSAVSVIEGYAKHYGCSATPARDRIAPGVTSLRYGHCDNGARVVLDTIAGGRHAWPGGIAAGADKQDSAAGRAFPATDQILQFFATSVSRRSGSG